MNKTKLGISVSLLGAGIVFAAAFGGYIPAILLAGYVFLCEDDEWLKRTAIKAIALLIAFSVLYFFIGLIPDLVNWINNLIRVFSTEAEGISLGVINRIFSFLRNTVSFIENIVFVFFGIKALGKGTLTIPVVDGLIQKNM